MKTIGPSVMISCASICETVQRAIPFISRYLNPEDTWKEAEHACVLVVNAGGIGGTIYILQIYP